MTHARPIPEAQRAPWPAQPAPASAEDAVDSPDNSAALAPEAHAVAHGGEAGLAIDDRMVKKIGVGTAIGVGAAIGSAAIAAALLYTNYGRKK